MRSLFTTATLAVLLIASCLTSCSHKEGIVRPAELQPVRKLFSLTSPELTAPAGEVVALAQRAAEDKKLRFQVPASVATREFSLEPYNGIHFCRYSIYFKDYSEED